MKQQRVREIVSRNAADVVRVLDFLRATEAVDMTLDELKEMVKRGVLTEQQFKAITQDAESGDARTIMKDEIAAALKAQIQGGQDVDLATFGHAKQSNDHAKQLREQESREKHDRTGGKESR